MAATIDQVDAAELSYAAFCEQYMARNRPVLIRNVVDKWFAPTRRWRAPRRGEQDPNEAIDFEWLCEHYGHHDVPVVDGDAEEYGCREYTTMKFADYLDLIKTGNAGMRYLKDWHFVRATQSESPVYEYVGKWFLESVHLQHAQHLTTMVPCISTPDYFRDDWLNWWWDRKDESGDDYRFVYIGPAGSRTPMHHDVFRSYSWSVNIVGRKEWIFFHPDDEAKLKDKFGRSVIADVADPYYDKEMYSRVGEATPMYVTQVSGDAIFVPSGWYHQVKNLEHTISINHNWFNGYNLREIWAFLKREYAAVEAELAHLQEIGLQGAEFRDQCQLVMKANSGINYDEFLKLLHAKASDIEHTRELNSKGGEMSTANHLTAVREVMSELVEYFGEELHCVGQQC